MKSSPNAIVIFMGMKELNLIDHGMNSPVSGWTAVETIVHAFLTSLISSSVIETSRLPDCICYASSRSFCFFSRIHI